MGPVARCPKRAWLHCDARVSRGSELIGAGILRTPGDIAGQLSGVEKRTRELELERMLSGPQDRSDAIVNITTEPTKMGNKASTQALGRIWGD